MKMIPVKLNLKKASEVLEAARKIIRNEKRWTQQEFAVDDMGDSCSTRSKHARAFCALGAVRRINGPAQKSATAYLREAAKTLLNTTGQASNDLIFHVNDSQGHTETLKMFGLAIRAAKRDEK